MRKPIALYSYSADLMGCFLAILIAWIICLEFLTPITFSFYALSAILIATLLVGLGYWFGLLYPSVGSYMGMDALIRLNILAGVFAVAHFFILNLVFNISILNLIRGFFIEVAIIGFFLIILRVLGKNFIRKKYPPISNLPAIVIYGAGQAGEQLLRALMYDSHVEVKCFIDDSPKLHGRRIGGKKIYSPENMQELIDHYELTNVIVAMPSLSNELVKNICDKLSQFPLKISTLPHLSQLAMGLVNIADIKEINLDDLLERDDFSSIPHSLVNKIEDSIVLVTGAGGSIGSELCRQLEHLRPKKIILVEISEFALFSIYSELKQLNHQNQTTQIVSLLCDVTDQALINQIFDTWRPDIVFHAAAYKHVSIVEENVCAGLRVNILGTLCIAIAALRNSVKNVVLVSTDKAVKPTNIMGASKRVAELIFQAASENPKLFLDSFSLNNEFYKNEQSKGFQDIECILSVQPLIFSIVRFGNVLGSSGSVVPIFLRQIADGGPVKVTHPNVVRYFMTIPEAAKLVIHANSMAIGGEVFILDMGKPKKILDLARKLIHLSGKRVSGEDGDGLAVEIEFTGLRPGEKLYEELLLTENVGLTDHPRIYSANENFLSSQELLPYIENLKRSIAIFDVPKIYECLEGLVESFSAIDKPVDITWCKLNSCENSHTP
uniref:polysaccharide biosynthesis protein n=1 Tax=Polynucleobacter sp. TaxID=2029855 RepID=UPI004047D3C5